MFLLVVRCDFINFVVLTRLIKSQTVHVLRSPPRRKFYSGSETARPLPTPSVPPVVAREKMSLAVTQCVETADSELGRVVEMRPGWLKTAYAQRGDALTKLNVVAYVDQIGMPAAEQPSEPPMVNYRYYFDMPKFAELRAAAETDPEIDLQITAEMQAMPAGACTPSWFLKQYQLKECGLCGTREGKLSICNGCRSFVYCCSEHQATRSLLTELRSTEPDPTAHLFMTPCSPSLRAPGRRLESQAQVRLFEEEGMASR